MKFTYNWLKDFVDVKLPPQKLADKLTMAGIEVVSLEERDGDCIFEIEITSNRPDWLSVIGIAREVAAITNSKLKVTSHKSQVTSHKQKHATCDMRPLSIKVENKNDCPLYTAKIIKGVKVGPAPEWMRKRLELIGCRSVNNVVDITNYILFTYGHPLHAFDLHRLNSDTIVVRRAKSGERIATINDKAVGLDKEILVIANKDKPVAVAGVIGGKDTEVTGDTKEILLESAVFNPVIVRRSRQKLGLQTESSYRFERGTDFQTAVAAALKALTLLQEFAAGICAQEKSTALPQKKKKMIALDAASVAGSLGINISPPRIKAILSHLGFKVKQRTRGNFSVEPPPYRQDAVLEIDLIEELARISGYEQIPASLPQVKPRLIPCPERELTAAIKNMLLGLGLNEVITYSLVDRAIVSGYLPQSEAVEPVEILNPLSKEQEILRPVIGPSLIQCIARNLNQKQDYVNIFEIANIFPGHSQGSPREELALGIALCGERSTLLEQGLVKEKMGLLHLKGILETLLQRLGISEYRFISGESGEVSLLRGQEKLCSLRKINKEFLNKLEIKNRDVFVAEVYLDKLFSCADLKPKFKELPVYPGILRDISRIFDENIPADQILSVIKENAGPLLEESKVSDCYKGESIATGQCRLTISCLYRSAERTLTDGEVNPVHARVLQALDDKFGVQIR